MKKLFCVLTVVSVIALCFGAFAVSATKEQDEQILVGGNAEPTATNPDQGGKITVWSGNIDRDFTTGNTVAVIDVDELTAAIRNDLTVNGVPTKYEIEAVATYVSGPSGNASWGFFKGYPVDYMALWADKGSDLTKAIFSNEKEMTFYLSASNAALCLYSDNSGDVVNVQSLTLYAYRESGATASATNAEPVMLGDANGDGAVNMKDVLMLRAFLCGHINFDKEENVWVFWDMNPARPKKIVTVDLMNADANADGEINMKDTLMVRKYLAGIIEKLGA